MVAEEQKRELLEFAVQMARRVGAIHLEWFRRSDLEIGTKSNEFDVVTRADRESEACIACMVAERYPSHALLGEEGDLHLDAIRKSFFAFLSTPSARRATHLRPRRTR